MSFDNDGPRLIEELRERLDAADEEFNEGDPITAGDLALDAARRLLDVLTPPPTNETPEQIARDVYFTVHSFPVPLDGDLMRDLIQRGVVAGIQAGWESWEPENAPGLAEMPLVCAECGTTEATTWVVTFTGEDRHEGRTEVCRSCDDELMAEERAHG